MKGNEYVAYTMLRKKMTANRGWILSNSIAWKLETTPLKLDEWIPNNDFFQPMFGIHLFNFRSVYWLNAQPWAAKKYRESQGKPSNDCRSPRHLSGVNLCVPHVHVQIIHLCIDVYRFTDTCILYYICIVLFIARERELCFKGFINPVFASYIP